jgi:hypothetical protein
MRQKIKKEAYRFLTPAIRNFIDVQKGKAELRRLAKASCNTTALSRDFDQPRLAEIFLSRQINEEWPGVDQETASLIITDSAGGVNLGDRRAIFYLVRHLRPKSVLEIGTHIGASTVYAVAALQKNQFEDRENSYHFTTVDVLDVNDARSNPWLKHGSTYSPREMITTMGAANYVTFITSSSLEYFSSCKEVYDFIFLDGDHSAKIVYQEIPAALRVLNQGGVILLHDYFPNLRPLWSNNTLVPGPCLGTQRLKAEGAEIKVLPLGELPWTTKLNSRITSLALLVA